jgi:organic hydroperoxide reductase OsmC/OhrA
MKPYPHHYSVDATAGPTESVDLSAAGLPSLASAPPVEFDGPGDQWSPETLLVAALADCFILTFRAVARASRLEWSHLACHAAGTLERVDSVTRFTGFRIEARLGLPPGSNTEMGKRLLEKAEKSCLVTNSLAAPVELVCEVSSS